MARRQGPNPTAGFQTSQCLLTAFNRITFSTITINIQAREEKKISKSKPCVLKHMDDHMVGSHPLPQPWVSPMGWLFPVIPFHYAGIFLSMVILPENPLSPRSVSFSLFFARKYFFGTKNCSVFLSQLSETIPRRPTSQWL